MKTIKTFLFAVILLYPVIIFCQDSKAYQFRNLPETKLKKAVTAPGYCESYGGSVTFERISNVHVLEKPGNLLEITIEVFIANPFGCESGEPCPSYDASPEYVNVWIDWDGDQIWEAHEQVINEALTGYQNINYSGAMTTKKQVEIPANAKRPAWMRANLGWNFDPQDPCDVSWNFGNVVDQQVLWNLRVSEINATLNVEMIDVPKPLWQANYDNYGNILSTISDRPVAAQLVFGYFYLPVKLISFPADLGDDSKTLCDWAIVYYGNEIQGTAGFSGKSGVLEIKLPNKLGIYKLELNFKFHGSNFEQIGEQKITIPLYVTYGKPKLPSIKHAWLRKAMEWCRGYQLRWSNGTANDHLLAEIMTRSIHEKSGWIYINDPQAWYKLVEGQVQHGLCTNMAEVWMNLLKVLGVEDVSREGHLGRNGKGFVSLSSYVALGGLNSAEGNAQPSDFFPSNYDRWLFGSHYFGKKGTKYYDPTFNLVSLPGADKYFHVAWDIIDDTYTTSSNGPKIEFDGQFDFNEGNWSKFVYSFPGTGQPNSVNTQFAEGARFTGSFSDLSLNNDDDNIFEQLSAMVGVEVTIPGNYFAYGFLKQGDSIITTRPFHSAASQWFSAIDPGTGTKEIQPLFSGEDIFNSKLNGPYLMKLFITDSTGNIVDADSFSTSGYNYTDFGELPTRIIQISETAADTTDDSFFDEIIINADIQTNLAGNYTFDVSLTQSGDIFASGNKQFSLQPGSNQLAFSLSTNNISQAGLDGPFSISVQVQDENGMQTAYNEILTANYLSEQFAPPDLIITGEGSDEGEDTNNNSLFDSLKVILNLEINESNLYKIRAWLSDSDDSLITWAESEKYLNAGVSSAELNFSGKEINRKQINGPYNISNVTVTKDSTDLVFSGSNLYQTQNYSVSQFETIGTQLISSTDNYFESTIDSDSDGLIDSLVIEIEVIPTDSGNVAALGRLVDSENETIQWSSTIEFLQEETPGLLHLKFDGRFIFGNLNDGPYKLNDLQIYHVGDPGQTINIPEAYTTHNYSYNEFENAGVITGFISDTLGNPVMNALLITENDNDYSNKNGKYNLVILNEDETSVKIEGPDTLQLDWSIFINDVFSKYGDSLIISVETGEIINIDFKAPVIISEIEEENSDSQIPTNYFLMQNYPNPFNSSTLIKYSLPIQTFVTLKIYDMLGNEISILVNKVQNAGIYEVKFDASFLSSGIYFFNLYTKNFNDTKRMVLMK